MATDLDLERELVRLLAVVLVIRILQIIAGILALMGLWKGQWPESILALLFAMIIGGFKPKKEGN